MPLCIHPADALRLSCLLHVCHGGVYCSGDKQRRYWAGTLHGLAALVENSGVDRAALVRFLLPASLGRTANHCAARAAAPLLGDAGGVRIRCSLPGALSLLSTIPQWLSNADGCGDGGRPFHHRVDAGAGVWAPLADGDCDSFDARVLLVPAASALRVGVTHTSTAARDHAACALFAGTVPFLWPLLQLFA